MGHLPFFFLHPLRDFDNCNLSSLYIIVSLTLSTKLQLSRLSSLSSSMDDMLWTSTSLPLKTSYSALTFFQEINFLWPVFSWWSARRWLYLQAVKLVPYNWLIKRLLIAEIRMMEAEDIDPVALAFYTVLCSWRRIIHSKPERNWYCG